VDGFWRVVKVRIGCDVAKSRQVRSRRIHARCGSPEILLRVVNALGTIFELFMLRAALQPFLEVHRMVEALVLSKLHGQPTQKIAKTGNPYFTVQVRAHADDSNVFINRNCLQLGCLPSATGAGRG
jgi:hypothetical protein